MMMVNMSDHGSGYWALDASMTSHGNILPLNSKKLIIVLQTETSEDKEIPKLTDEKSSKEPTEDK